jgi:hypothetical protein
MGRRERTMRGKEHMMKASKSYKYAVKALGEFVLDYSEHFRQEGKPSWFIGRGTVAGNTQPIPSGLHRTPREAWKAAAIALGVANAAR